MYVIWRSDAMRGLPLKVPDIYAESALKAEKISTEYLENPEQLFNDIDSCRGLLEFEKSAFSLTFYDIYRAQKRARESDRDSEVYNILLDKGYLQALQYTISMDPEIYKHSEDVVKVLTDITNGIHAADEKLGELEWKSESLKLNNSLE